MNHEAIIIFGVLLSTWGLFVPLLMWLQLRKAEKENSHLQTELKSILNMLNDSRRYREEKEQALKEATNRARQPIFASPKYMHTGTMAKLLFLMCLYAQLAFSSGFEGMWEFLEGEHGYYEVHPESGPLLMDLIAQQAPLLPWLNLRLHIKDQNVQNLGWAQRMR